MKVHSLTILHYGKDYLSYALRSVYHSVDQVHVFYTPSPSHGHQTNIPPIETKEELQAAAYAYDPDNKVKWYDMIGVTHEGPQRDLALRTVEAAGAELVLVVDCDEVWPGDFLGKALQYAARNHNKRRMFLVNMFHFWRSFNWACEDNGWPVRIIDLRYSDSTPEYLPAKRDLALKVAEVDIADLIADYGEMWIDDFLSSALHHSDSTPEYLPVNLLGGRVFHFGYAVTNRVMEYKWKIHGHKNELRPDWLSDIWPVWPPPPDCHPTNDKNFWMPEPFDKLKLPIFMAEHPFFGMDKIE